MSVNAQDMIEIQKSDPYLNGIRLPLEDNYETKPVNSHFVLHKNLLFKNNLVLGEPVLRLCLPELLCANILRTLHDSSKCHITRMNLIDQYNCNFYTKGIKTISKMIIQGCLHCALNSKRRKLLVKGSRREFESNTTPGEIWILDVLFCLKAAVDTALSLSRPRD